MSSAVVSKKKKKLSNNKRRKLEQLYNDAKLSYKANNLVATEQLAQEMLKIDAESPDAYHIMGCVAEKLGNVDGAKTLYEHGFLMQTGHLELMASCAGVYFKLGDYLGAAQLWNKYTELEPKNADAWQSLTASLFKLARWDSAELTARRAVDLAPNNSAMHRNLGLVLVKQKKLDEAEAEFKKAVDLAPEDSDARFAYARQMMESGRMEEAFDEFQNVLKYDPDHASTYHMLFRFWKVEEYSDQVKRAETLHASDKTPDEEQQMLCFSLGKAWEDLGDYEKSFTYYADGNRRHREDNPYDLEDDRRDAEELKQMFTEDFFSGCDSESGYGEEFLFIVGMPRSGSTLMDRIVSAHPKVVDTGETDLFRKLVGVLGRDGSGRMNMQQLIETDAGTLAEAAQGHLQNMQRYFGKAERFTDKALPNLWLIGAIRLIFPKAKILHCSRNPLDNCLSIFAHNFEGNLFKWAYDLKELGEYYRIYLDMMAHWDRVLSSDVFLNISYEQLVAAPEEETRRIIAFCDLEWDDACLSFYKKKSNVQTASLAQIREPINKRSVDRWRKFEKYLQPLIEALGDAVDID